MELKYYIDDKEVDGFDYYDIIFEYIVKDLASYTLDDYEVEGSAPYFAFEELCKDDGIRYEAEGIDEDIYLEQLREVRALGRSEVKFAGKLFTITKSVD